MPDEVMNRNDVSRSEFFFGPRRHKWIGFLTMTLVLNWVEDAPTRNTLAKALSESGFESLEVGSQESALDALRTQAIGAVVMGLELEDLRRLQGDFPLVPILVVGQAEGSTEAIEIVQAGAFDFLPVPFEQVELKALVAEACLLYTSPSPRDQRGSRMPSSA